MTLKTGLAIAAVAAGIVTAPMAPAMADDGRHLAFGLGAAAGGVLALLLSQPHAEAAPPPVAYAPPPVVYAPPPVAYYPPPPVVYYAPPHVIYGPGYYYWAR